METKPEHDRGARVRIKNGDGPVMVVAEVYQPFFQFRYRCKWTDGNGVVQVDIFRSIDLVPAA